MTKEVFSSDDIRSELDSLVEGCKLRHAAAVAKRDSIQNEIGILRRQISDALYKGQSADRSTLDDLARLEADLGQATLEADTLGQWETREAEKIEDLQSRLRASLLAEYERAAAKAESLVERLSSAREKYLDTIRALGIAAREAGEIGWKLRRFVGPKEPLSLRSMNVPVFGLYAEDPLCVSVDDLKAAMGPEASVFDINGVR